MKAPRLIAAQDIAVASSTPLPVTQSGSTGTDFSRNKPSVPADNDASTPLLLTIPANPSRAFFNVQNQSANTLQVVRDDGSGGNVTSILLAGNGAGQQGASTSSSTFKGRVRVYGAAGSQVAAYQD